MAPVKHAGGWLFASLICAVPLQVVNAQTVEEFYRGRTLSLVISSDHSHASPAEPAA